MTRSGGTPRNRVRKVPNPRRLIHLHGRRIGYPGQIDRVGVIDGRAANEVHIGRERAYRRSSGIDGNHGSTRWSSRNLVRVRAFASRVLCRDYIKVLRAVGHGRIGKAGGSQP